jgi:hypothetical protein
MGKVKIQRGFPPFSVLRKKIKPEYCCWRKNERDPQCTVVGGKTSVTLSVPEYCCWRKNKCDSQCTVVGGKTSATLSVLLMAEK